MKRHHLLFFALSLLTSILMVGCGKDNGEDKFNSSDLIGTWADGTEHWRYDSDGTGATWNSADDVSESEARQFSWKLSGDQLQHTMQSYEQDEFSFVTAQDYTILELTSSTLSWDTGLKTQTLTRVR